MNLKTKFSAILAGASVMLITADVHAQSAPNATNTPSDADILLNMFQKKGVISGEDANQAREALAANHRALADTNGASPLKFKMSNAFKSVELYGDLRMR